MVGRPRSVGLGGKPLKSALHHWWPRGLSLRWADDDGMVTRLASDRTTLRGPPSKFGAIKNAHHIKLGAPWSTTIEPIFDDADRSLPMVAAHLESLGAVKVNGTAPFEERLSPHGLSDDLRARLGEGLASLIVRCPAHRDLLHLTTESFFGRMGQNVRTHDETLIAANINQHYRQIVASLVRGGKIVLLRASTSEFVMGEGYLNTISGVTIEPQYKCLLPLTPTMAVLAFSMHRYWAQPPAFAIALTDAEVGIVNEITQIYTGNYLYYRRIAPKISNSFTLRQFRQLEYHRHPWLEALMRAVAEFSPY